MARFCAQLHLCLPYGHGRRGDDGEYLSQARHSKSQDWLPEWDSSSGIPIGTRGLQGSIKDIVLDGLDPRRERRRGRDGCGGHRDRDVQTRGGVGGQERGPVGLVYILLVGGGRRQAIMGDGDVDMGRLAAAGCVYSRGANRPVHGWLSGARGMGDMSSSGPIQWLAGWYGERERVV